MPTVERFLADMEQFNDDEVGLRRDLTPAQAWAEYEEIYQRALLLMEQIPGEVRNRPGILPWYGEEYDLNDFIAYTIYGHKREYSAQIASFRDQVARAEWATV